MRKHIEIEHSTEGQSESVRLLFGPHYYIEVLRHESKFEFFVGASHHGFRADATEIGGELERVVAEIRERHPEMKID